MEAVILGEKQIMNFLQEENSGERVRKPDDPVYHDQEFMELIRLIMGSSAYSKGLSRQKSNYIFAG